MIFIDTPGMHIKSEKTMNKILNRSAQSIIDDSDIILFVIQRLSFDKNDELILEKLQESNQKIICIVNKIDQVEDKNKFLPFINEISLKKEFLEIMLISAKTNNGIDDLVSVIKNNLPENSHIYNDDFELEENNKKFVYSELIREKIESITFKFSSLILFKESTFVSK